MKRTETKCIYIEEFLNFLSYKAGLIAIIDQKILNVL